jgi:hypothetical protein
MTIRPTRRTVPEDFADRIITALDSEALLATIQGKVHWSRDCRTLSRGNSMADDVNVNRINDPVVYSNRPAVLLNETVAPVSWGAIWAGVMAALGMEALFSLFGLFIGFGMYSANSVNPWGGVPTWSLVWFLVTAGWSMFFGAWCAARLAGYPLRQVGVLHGIATWGLTSFVTIAIVVLVSWAVLREGINVLGSVSAAIPPVAVPGPSAQNTASDISSIALRICGGVLLGFITALIGGAVGAPSSIRGGAVRQEIPGGTRRAA